MFRTKKVVIALLAVLVCLAGGIATLGMVSKAGNGDNKLVIYYSGTAEGENVHYQIGNGNWTQVPGVAMQANTDIDGYHYKAVIEMGSETEVTACFNDKYGNWDNNDNKNYKFTNGTYLVQSYGYIQKIDDVDTQNFNIAGFYTSCDKAAVNRCIGLSAAATGGTAPYRYTFECEKDGVKTTLRENQEYGYYTWISYKSGSFDITVTATDANGNKASKQIKNFVIEGMKILSVNTSLQAPQAVNTDILLSTTTENEAGYRYNSYIFYVEKDGVTQRLQQAMCRSVTWTPKEAGTYKIRAYVGDYTGQTAEKTIEYTVKPQTDNKVTIYYNAKNTSNYAYTYIHYCTDKADWTKAPGVIMNKCTDVEGYTDVITIDLLDASKLIACFNDGCGNWDSKYGQNYSFTPGIYYLSDYQIKNQK